MRLIAYMKPYAHWVIFALLLVLTLFCPSALAETIRQQVNAPESLQDTFTSNTGRMTIDIKADVIVPDISTLYEIDVTPRLFNDEELSRLVKGFQQTDSQLDADYQVLFGISRLYEAPKSLYSDISTM